MDSSKTYSSANRMICELFEGLRRLCIRISSYSSGEEKHKIRQDTALAVILSVQCVEAFINIYFRVLISEEDYGEAFTKVIRDLESRSVGITQKLKEWPFAVFGKNLDLGKGAAQKFIGIINLRNELMHFKSSHESIDLPGHKAFGLADSTSYDSLTQEFAQDILSASEGVLEEIFALRGISVEKVPHSMHAWTGKFPI